MSKSSKLFRQSLSGYNKNDVNEYIEEIDLRAKKREEELEAKIAKVEAELQKMTERAMTAEARDFSEETAEYEAKIKALEEKLCESDKINEAKSEYSEQLEASLVEKNSQINELTEKVYKLEQTVADANSTLEKAAQYDALSHRLGEIMLGAGNTAEKILADANEKAASLIAQAAEKRDHCLDVLKKYTEKYCDKLSEVTVASAQERLDRIHSEMAEFEASITRSVMDARKQTGSVKEYIDELRQSLDTSLDSILNSTNTASPEAIGVIDPSEAAMEKLLEESVSDILSQINSELED
jgi:chromosome segregation ATPase